MRITKLSENFSPIHEGIFFDIDTESSTPENLTVEIIDTRSREVIATQLLREVTSAKVNIAPYMARLNEYAPTSHKQTTFTAAPSQGYRIRINNIESEEICVSVNHKKIAATPSFISSQPLSRRISYGKSDELLIFAPTGGRLSVEITANNGESIHVEHLATSDVTTLAISTGDFGSDIRSLEATLYCNGVAFGTLCYIVSRPLKTATHLAWISESGAIEQYTFPSSHKSKKSVSRQLLSTSNGVISTRCNTKESITVCSRFEPRATIESLAQIVSAPKVWMERESGFELVEVVSPTIDYNIFNEPDCIHFELCSERKEVSL